MKKLSQLVGFFGSKRNKILTAFIGLIVVSVLIFVDLVFEQYKEKDVIVKVWMPDRYELIDVGIFEGVSIVNFETLKNVLLRDKFLVNFSNEGVMYFVKVNGEYFGSGTVHYSKFSKDVISAVIRYHLLEKKGQVLITIRRPWHERLGLIFYSPTALLLTGEFLLFIYTLSLLFSKDADLKASLN